MNSIMEVDGSAVASSSLALCFGIPPADRVEFGDLAPKVQRAVYIRLEHMETIHNARRKQTACKAIAGAKWQRLRALYYQFVASRDWRVLLDKRKAPAANANVSVPPRFIDFVFEIYERHGRKFAPAHLELLDIWRTHHRLDPKTGQHIHVKSIPGYAEWPQAEPDTDLPAGWTYGNLQRKVTADKYAEAATKQGRTAAVHYRPQVPVTREQLKAGQRVFIDDQWYDVEVNFLGIAKRSLRPLGLDMLDHLSGCFIRHGFRPRLREETTGINRSIKVEETTWLVVDYLTNVGFRPDTGTIIVHEHGTANFPEAFKALVTQVTDGKVTFDASGLYGNPAFAGQFEGQSKGNFRYKAPLESAYNLVRNRQGALIGATGHDRNPPEQLYGLKRYNDRLLMAAEALPPERRKLLQYPLLNWHDFILLALHFYDAIDTRDDHKLEGWQRLGFITYEYRLTPDPNAWRPMDELAMFPVEQSNAIRALLDAQPHLKRNRYLSPREVWNARKHELVKLPDSMVGLLLGERHCFTAKVTDEGYFRIKDRDLDSEPITYLARLGGSNGSLLNRGQEFLVFQNVFQPDRLIVHDKTRDGKLGPYLGTAKLWGREDVLDTAAIHRRCGEVAEIESELLVPIARRGREITRAKIAMHEHNAAVLAGFNTPAERVQAECRETDLMEQATAALLKNAKTYNDDTEE
jgi:hypothetical protein